ncbi:prepilin-type N-terminal cleavage/methylation domain-containing protein [Colwellia sp. 1_MG-2023]|uniref:PilW family protein n=1 Tax=Colwellia sp. 1_MG-2023 TaxID=3062649 RepID=UPI0026E1A8DB|nr:prepilin-type N-terminal cleavage/methylation domain-containing protein [Colwellia sp. 1_MG-2023]MDO6444336.1 prepilin-type N-terminal cleavage/methylation domain-containing protein [Colwellia sp. 1_MG-2023]
MKLKQSNGFTLIEVLIASVILFTALALTAELYNSSSLSANKITENARVSQASIVAVQAIKSDLRKLAENRKLSEHVGELTINGIYFQWQATREKFNSRAMELSDAEPPRNQFSLFNVSVNVQSKQSPRQPFSFKVVTW